MLSWVSNGLIAPCCLVIKVPGNISVVKTCFVPYQNKATEHHNEQNKPLRVFVLHKASDATSKLEPHEVLFGGCRKSAALGQTVINFNNISVGYPSWRFAVGQYNITN